MRDIYAVAFFNCKYIAAREYFRPRHVYSENIYLRGGCCIHDVECKRVRSTAEPGIVRFSGAAARHCNNSKTVILFPERRIRTECTYAEDHRIYITDAASLRVRGKITLPVTPRALFRIEYFIGKKHTWRPSRRYPVLYLFIEAVPGRTILSVVAMPEIWPALGYTDVVGRSR